MKAKTFLLKILFLFLTSTLTNCTKENIEDQISQENFANEINEFDAYLIDKDDIEEPDDRE